MKREFSSAGLQLSALILATIACVEAVSFAVVLGMPTPEPDRITIGMAAEGLQGGAIALPLRRRVAKTPPQGIRAHLVEDAIADMYNVDRTNLRATWTSDQSVQIARSGPLSANLATSPNAEKAGSAPDALLGEPEVFSVELSSALQSLPLPPFSVALRQTDGSWLTIEPQKPLLTIWQMQLLAAFLISAVVLIPVAILAARHFTRPLRELGRFAEADDVRPAPVPPSGSTREIVAALDAIVRMRDRLARRADQRVRILAAVAHDLRTPMTGLRLRVEDAAEPDRTKMIADLDRMEEMIGHMLSYAREGIRLQRAQQVNVNDVVAQVANSFPPEAVSILPNPRRAELQIDREALERAIGNLVRNAIDYAGSAEIEVRPTPAELSVFVRDRGPGISVHERARVVLPFERGETSRSRRTGGVGLGLSTVFEFAQRYGGELRLLDRPGGGLSAEIILPRSA